MKRNGIVWFMIAFTRHHLIQTFNFFHVFIKFLSSISNEMYWLKGMRHNERYNPLQFIVWIPFSQQTIEFRGCAPRVSIYFNNSFIRCVRTHSFIIKIKFHSLLYVASFIPLNSFIPFRSLLSLPEWMVEMNYEINLIVGESGMRIATAITHFVSINDWIPLSPFATFIHFFSLRAVSIHFNFNSAPGVSARCINN